MRPDNMLQGLTYAGEVISKSGQVLPMYDMAEETAESWNATARKAFLRLYMQEHGTPPEDFDAAHKEHQEYVKGLVEQISKESGPGPAIPVIKI